MKHITDCFSPLQVAELTEAKDAAIIESDILRQALTQANADVNELQDRIAAYYANRQALSDLLDANNQRRRELEARVHELEVSSAAAAAVAAATINELKLQLKAFTGEQLGQRQQNFEAEPVALTLNSMHVCPESSHRSDGFGTLTSQQQRLHAAVGECTYHTQLGILYLLFYVTNIRAACCRYTTKTMSTLVAPL
jgi:chromosome segregation ATPase